MLMHVQLHAVSTACDPCCWLLAAECIRVFVRRASAGVLWLVQVYCLAPA